nr:aminotransferase class I/II-fold pyridoxal phosphate-dependent enzyme [Methylomarinum sp. Ch1-1]MDP4523116.1 aminotransferase class I/II-fold pyridoxal phosphate-dependent enzyme [Methylomarinum sp. Ch1-1]
MAAVGIAMTFLIKPGDRVVIHEPVWPNITNAARVRYAEIDIVSLKLKNDGSFLLDIDALHEKLKGARLFFLIHPITLVDGLHQKEI